MVHFLKLSFLLVLAALIFLVAFANNTPVQVKGLPEAIGAFFGLTWQAEMPLYLVLFLSLMTGIAIGFVWEWLREHQHRAKLNAKKREINKLKQELSKLSSLVNPSSKPKEDENLLALLKD